MILKSFFTFLILFVHLSCLSQDFKIGIVEVKPLPKGIFPFVFYKDSVSKEYIEKYMLINGKFINHSFARPIELSSDFDMLTFFTFLKKAVNEVDNETKFENKTPILQVFLTDGMNKIDSIQSFSIKHANLVFEKTLDRCFVIFHRSNYDKILFTFNSIVSIDRPRYFEIVK